MKTIILPDPERIERCTELLCRVLQEKPEAVVALSAADACLPVYEKLSGLARKGEVCLSAARFFAAAEFEGLTAEDERSCSCRLSAAFSGTGAELTFLTPDSLDRYDALIAEAGGLDLAVLGLGINARIGFNEIATPFDSRAHRQKLAPATRRELAPLFGGEEQVPVFGLTMGIKTFMEAHEILVTAAGADRAKAVYNMLYGRDDSVVPAAFLQIPSSVTAVVDEEAAILL